MNVENSGICFVGGDGGNAPELMFPFLCGTSLPSTRTVNPFIDAAGMYTICPWRSYTYGRRPMAQSNAGMKRGPGAGVEKLTPSEDDTDTVDPAALCKGTVVHTTVVGDSTCC